MAKHSTEGHKPAQGPLTPSAPACCRCSSGGTKATLFGRTSVMESTGGKVSYVSDQESQATEGFISLLVPMLCAPVCQYS